ncbi:unnamed protein product [Lupinus luteus]|uniref:Uncharacterized protein n=1 Tax=Lupinus luteus TaxID=3873 RepID=A0AAV1W790_LUPLU
MGKEDRGQGIMEVTISKIFTLLQCLSSSQNFPDSLSTIDLWKLFSKWGRIGEGVSNHVKGGVADSEGKALDRLRVRPLVGSSHVQADFVQGVWIGELKSYGKVEEAKRCLTKEGRLSVQLIPIGGKKVLLKASTEEDTLDLINNAECFRRKIRMDVGCFLVATQTMERVELKVKLQVGACLFEILLLEDFSLNPLRKNLESCSDFDKDSHKDGLEEGDEDLWIEENSCWGEHVIGREDEDEDFMMFPPSLSNNVSNSSKVSMCGLEESVSDEPFVNVGIGNCAASFVAPILLNAPKRYGVDLRDNVTVEDDPQRI